MIQSVNNQAGNHTFRFSLLPFDLNHTLSFSINDFRHREK